ncbi:MULTISPECIES: hypothetical protein [unclassified Streptomyces]|uniref:hypothetical protein n=1 Tax=unclassified Streptomyces TaxID=2593676 RepID=UPI002DD969DA|nr:hypothetical protein [Streptomyces sp. NBC_01750]WSA99665.1 hypothetical protein OIE54_10490 [Streptomyces sp. NBC_01794]WSD35886.1 hypothetical protein OG966_30680 [Streptomyces sp. NBC_01750]
MSNIDGKWSITIASPIGPQHGTVDITRTGAALSGTATAMGSTVVIEDGRLEGDRAQFTINMERPMPMKMDFDLIVAGDSLTGGTIAGTFGRLPVTGQRD